MTNDDKSLRFEGLTSIISINLFAVGLRVLFNVTLHISTVSTGS